MRQTMFLLAFVLFQGMLLAQPAARLNPDLKVGTTFIYELNAQGQSFPMTLKISAIGDQGLIFDYDIAGQMIGKFTNSDANLNKGQSLNWDQPSPGEERKLPDDQTIAMMSRPFLADLKKNKSAKYDGVDLTLKPIKDGEQILAGGKEVDALYVESGDGVTKYWILNNEKYPVLLKVEGLPSGITMTLKEIMNP